MSTDEEKSERVSETTEPAESDVHVDGSPLEKWLPTSAMHLRVRNPVASFIQDCIRRHPLADLLSVFAADNLFLRRKYASQIATLRAENELLDRELKAAREQLAGTAGTGASATIRPDGSVDYKYDGSDTSSPAMDELAQRSKRPLRPGERRKTWRVNDPAGSRLHVALWDAIDKVVIASGGRTSITASARQHAVIGVEAVLTEICDEAAARASAQRGGGPQKCDRHGGHGFSSDCVDCTSASRDDRVSRETVWEEK